MYTIVILTSDDDSLTIMGVPPVTRSPEWFADNLFKWSVDGREWKSFMKED